MFCAAKLYGPSIGDVFIMFALFGLECRCKNGIFQFTGLLVASTQGNSADAAGFLVILPA